MPAPLPTDSLLLTDLYQLAMLEAYYRHGMTDEAVFEFFVRDLPPGWGYLVAAGLEQVLEMLETARFSDAELAWLAADGTFGAKLIERLRDWRFTGQVHALPEGSLCFPHEPILRVTAPLPEAQLVETRIINLLQYQTLVTTKAARCVVAAPGKLLVDFGLRRAHGAEAGLLAGRATYIGGFAGTSTVLAKARFGVPIFGTMAHSFVEAHDKELEAFAHFATARPNNLVLLIDTYDTEAAARRLGDLAPTLAAQGIRIRAVRIDSGDLADHAIKVRAILDEIGLNEVGIFASGSLDEYKLQEILERGAPVDGFGIGSRLDTVADSPYLDCAYKLMAYAGIPRRKHSEHKTTWPGAKQVLRRFDAAGRMLGDTIVPAGEGGEGTPLLRAAMAEGRRLDPPDTLEAARARLAEELQRLPDELKALHATAAYPVAISEGLREVARRTDEFIREASAR